MLCFIRVPSKFAKIIGPSAPTLADAINYHLGCKSPSKNPASFWDKKNLV